MIRVDGDLRKINLPPLEHKDVIKIIYDIMNDRQRKEYEEFFETDFSFEIANLARFRLMLSINRAVPLLFSELFLLKFLAWKI